MAELALTPEQQQCVQNILREHVPGLAVWVFGSRAKGTAKPYSDLDLAIISDTPLSFEVSGALASAFAESALPFKVDIVDWAITSERFRRVIESDKIPIQ